MKNDKLKLKSGRNDTKPNANKRLRDQFLELKLIHLKFSLLAMSGKNQ